MDLFRVVGSNALSAYTLKQDILSIIVSLDPGVVNGNPAESYSFQGSQC